MGEEKGAEGGEKEWGAPGSPRVLLKETVVSPPLVVRLREASPPIPQIFMNSQNEAPRNWEFVLVDIFLQRGSGGDRFIL